ncbi:small ribosomal subunit protein uS17m-like [Ptychodera flava]|uniref:small ribosomal subunit protein uS17m-like n=1 Tax=Ptychodera flava TaxID=63121 RepID=UPI00396A0AB5
MAQQVVPKLRLLLGQVFGKTVDRTAKVKVLNLELDEYVMKYFNKPKVCYVHVDEGKELKAGDVVLIQELPVPRSKLIHHSLEKIVYEVGRTVDPVTGRRCTYFSYLDAVKDTDVQGTDETAQGINMEQIRKDINQLEMKGDSQLNEGTPV